MASSMPGLRRAAPRLFKEFFQCRQWLPEPQPSLLQSQARGGFILSKNVRFQSSHAPPTHTLKSAVLETSESTPLGKIGKDMKARLHTEVKPPVGEPARKSFFPKTSSKSVGYWLLASAGSVFGIVVFGGLTRLTESGLSITEWKPVTGSLPPMSAEDWESEFSKYRASPEYKLLNPNMDLSEFKKIYFMEWGHRLWGRFVGLSFVLPAIYFVARRKVSSNMALRLAGISVLIGFQGVIGWWMVKSGLKDDLFAPGSHPRVSQYRLAAHLGAAFICYTAMFWNALAIFRQHKLLASPAQGLETLQQIAHKDLSFFRKSIAGLTVLVFITALSGALVAGLDAGLIYNEFPYMGKGLHPPGSELFDKFYCRKEDHSDLWWRNILENPSTVQLDHRTLAMTTFTVIVSLWAYSRFSSKVSTALPRAGRKGMLGLVHLVSLQVALGISTLLYLVPVPLAAAHQAGSLALLSGCLVLGSRIWMPKNTLRMLERIVKSRAGTTTKLAQEAQRPNFNFRVEKQPSTV